MKQRFLPRKPVVLSESSERRLGMYALAAAAAGVGAMALALPAEAEIIYTPAHLVVNQNGHDYCVDMNHDGKMDFCLEIYSHEGFCFVHATGGSQNRAGGIAANKTGGALPIRAGRPIGQSRNFIQSFFRPYMVSFNGYCVYSTWIGPWVVNGKGNKGLTNRYLGIRFGTHAKIHYGWARCSVYPGKLSHPVVMTGYAYETIPNKPIIAGKTKGPDVITLPVETEFGTLGHLALGRR